MNNKVEVTTRFLQTNVSSDSGGRGLDSSTINQYSNYTGILSKHKHSEVSIIVPTYNEAKNILNLIDSIQNNLPDNIHAEIIVVDDNSPDGTGKLVENYYNENINDNLILNTKQRQVYDNYPKTSVKVVHRVSKNGLVSAILQGIESSTSDYIIVMDADFSHPAEMIPNMINELKKSDTDIVIASRYVRGGSIKGWPIKRKLISKGAVKIAQYVLRVKDINDPMSGFFGFKRDITENITIDTTGYKILLEILVKAKNARVREIPYTFRDRQNGESKLGGNVILDYVKAVHHLHEYKKQQQRQQEQPKQFSDHVLEKKTLSVFLSKAGKFFVIGASGLLINYLTSFMLSNGMLSSLWYVKATLIGILLSMTSNFLLNKAWTFRDLDFSIFHTLRQYGLFAAISSFGAAIQLGLVYMLVESGTFKYEFALITAVAIASISNFILNKKLTFKEKIWS